MDNPKFTNTIASLYPTDNKVQAPVFYYDVIKGHHLANLYLKYTLAAIQLNIKEVTVEIEIVRDDGKKVFEYDTPLKTDSFYANGKVEEKDVITASFTSGPFKFEIPDDETHFYSVQMMLKGSNEKLLDTNKTWLMTRPEK